MKSLMTLMLVVALLSGRQASANYLLITGSGEIRDDWDETNYLGYGPEAGAPSNGNLYGRAMTVTWAVDLDNVPPNQAIGSSSHARYSADNLDWIYTLGVSVDGVSIFDNAFVPSSPSVLNQDIASPSIREDYTNWFAFSDRRSLETSFDLGGGSTQIQEVSQNTTFVIADFREFLTGLNLDQTFVWNSPFGVPYFDAQVNFNQQSNRTTCSSPIDCVYESPIDVHVNMWLSTVTAQVINTSIPEPEMYWLFALGAFLMVWRHRKMENVTSRARRPLEAPTSTWSR